MKRLTAHESLAHIGHLKNLLEQSGIACIIKNDQLSGGLGEIPFLDCLPELWVLQDEESFGRFQRIVEATPFSQPQWEEAETPGNGHVKGTHLESKMVT